MSTRKILKTPKKDSDGSGSYGDYWRFSKNLGLKVIGGYLPVEDWKKIFKNEERLMKENFSPYDGGQSTTVCFEYAVMKMLEGCRFTPNVYEVVWVKNEIGRYAMGILMEHIEGKTFEETYKDIVSAEEHADCLEEKIRDMMATDYGVDVEDWHPGNMILSKDNKEFRIDFSPEYLQIMPSHTNNFRKISREMFYESRKSLPKK